MARYFSARVIAIGLAFALAAHGALGAESDAADGCARFTWDVSHELAVMKQTPKAVSANAKASTKASTNVSAEVPALEVDTLYELKLAPQAETKFAVKPGKPTLDDSAQAGVFRFRAQAPGRYRVSITSGHWLDVVADQQIVKSRDFQGARGCERPHKIVEYELTAAGEYTLQLSGSTDASVVLAITPVKALPAS